MIGVDTNVLVRYFTHDNPQQTAKAVKLMLSFSPESPGFVSMVVMVELVWVLESSYGFPKYEVASALETLLRSKELVIERADAVLLAVRSYRTNRGGFADCLISACGQEAGCKHTLTFDREAARIEGMHLLE